MALTQDEAATLQVVLAKVGGSPFDTPRKSDGLRAWGQGGVV